MTTTPSTSVGPANQPLILLVEDHQDTRQMYAEFMGMRYRVLEAATGFEALQIAESRRPDLVITDLSLPDLDGFELIEKLRGEPALHDLRVICISGYGGYAHEQRARDLGCARLLLKPCLPDTLADTVAEVLSAPPARRQHG